MIASYAPPGHVMALASDPCLDYCFIGLQNGRYELAYISQGEVLTDQSLQATL